MNFGHKFFLFLAISCLVLSCAKVEVGGEGGDTDTNTDTDVDTDTDTDTDTDVDTDADTDTDTDSDTDTDPDTDPQTCGDNGDCGGDPCVDGYCCDDPCLGVCEACDLEGLEGICSPIAEGEDPDDECEEEDPSTCGTSGGCDGAGACAFYGSETACDDDELCTEDDACDGAGGCEGLTPAACDPGPANECCVGACSSISGCYTEEGDCADTCEANTLMIDDACVGCGAAHAEGVCTGGTAYECNSSSHTLCEVHECGGTTYFCTNDGGTWEWRTAIACDDGDDCTYSDTCSGGSCVATTYTCTSDDCMTRECDGEGGCIETPQPDTAECGTIACPSDECSGGSWTDYDAECTSHCDGSGSCVACTCIPSETDCVVGASNECCEAACSASGGCYTTAGSCGGGDSCADPNTLTVGSACNGCGANGANGTCGGGGTFVCNSSSHTVCESVSCGGTTYHCTNTGGAWQWRTSDSCDDGDPCTINTTCGGSGVCSGGGPATYCGDSTCMCGETTCNCWEDCGVDCGDGCCNGSETYATCAADCEPPCTLSVAEDFASTALPTGWGIQNMDGDSYGYTWTHATASPPSGGSGGYWWVDSDIIDAPPFDDRLITVLYEVGGCTSVTLSFDHEYDYYSGDYGTVDISVDGGAWQTLATYNYDTSGHIDISLTSYLTSASNFRIRFMYVADYDYHWKVDNFTLTAS